MKNTRKSADRVPSPSLPTPGLYHRVQFHFLSSDCDDLLQGDVLVRPGEMVVDIPGSASNDPYLIVGVMQDSYYQGRSRETAKDESVDANWAWVGNQYVGIWIEDGHEFLISFLLPRQPESPADRTEGTRSSVSQSMGALVRRMKRLDKKIAARKKREKTIQRAGRPRKGTPKKASPAIAKTPAAKLSEDLRRAVEREPTPKRTVFVYAPKR